MYIAIFCDNKVYMYDYIYVLKTHNLNKGVKVGFAHISGYLLHMQKVWTMFW